MIRKTSGGIIITTVLLLTLISIPAMNSQAFAEPSLDKIAKKAYKISLKIEAEKERLAEIEKDTSKRLEILNEKFESKLKILNKHGIVSVKQLESDPEYYGTMAVESVEKNDSSTRQSVTASSCASCQAINVDSGYYYPYWWIFTKWVYSDDGVDQLTFPNDSDTSDTTLIDDYSWIIPGMRAQLQIPGTGVFSYDYVYVGGPNDSETGSATVSSSSSPTVYTFDKIHNVEAGEYLSVDFTAISMNP